MSEHEEYMNIQSQFDNSVDNEKNYSTKHVTQSELAFIISRFENIICNQNDVISKLQIELDNLKLLINGKQFMKRSLSYESVDLKTEIENN
jgi:hypothetical protein